MKLCTFDEGEGPLTGVVEGETILPLRDTVAMLDLIQRGAGWAPAAPALPVHAVRLLAPIVPKRNVFCVGWNYAEHFAEGKDFRPASAPQAIPDHPALFSKNPFAIIGPGAAIRYPAPISEQLDYEVELAVVIGREGRDIGERDALDHVFGYTIANDVSVRDVQRSWHGGQWFKGKNFDTHLPLGPWIVTKDEIPDPQTLRITTRVNGVTKQDSNTKHMVFPVARIIAELSAGLTLHPGDVIITGTPEGVGMGRKPPEWLKPGDTVELEIERIGVLRNEVAEGV
ncbi:MAG: fumarylacetoacetate hydrolase family protein [Chloroflexota bacterium]|nr:fumarylacetoacetate hydrolase family protein [Chloroflexota bacterium]